MVSFCVSAWGDKKVFFEEGTVAVVGSVGFSAFWTVPYKLPSHG